jgi:selenocysteine-specific elongation factor
MQVIGTAGHVDHGKSSLIEALTGIHPDRLREEREREMTIVLGFAWMTLPNGKEIGIVDVPGHRDFIENMLSGIGGIDAALFVVAADEGVMQQTREHLAILDLLQIEAGVVALTKIDVVDDPDWLDLVDEDVRDVLGGTILENSPIVRVSAKTKEGISDLCHEIESVLDDRSPRPDLGRPRLPVDRVFTMPGFGTVVTGTLIDGQLRVGEEIEILPSGSRGRVRGLQTHKRKEEVATPGSRTAVNISGVRVTDIQRGDIVSHPGDYDSTRRMDVQFRLLPDVAGPLKHNMQVKLFIGASEVIARLRLLGADMIAPGETGWLQLETSKPVVAVRGDRYILRRPSPGETLGGGLIVDPHPSKRHKRYNQNVLDRLNALIGGAPRDVLFQGLLSLGAVPVHELIGKSNLSEEVARSALGDLLETGDVLILEGPADHIPPNKSTQLITSSIYWNRLIEHATKIIDDYHRTYPLRRGIPREELKSRLKISARIFNAFIEKIIGNGIIEEAAPLAGGVGKRPVPVVRRLNHEVVFSAEDTLKVQGLLNSFAASPYNPPTVKECVEEVGEDVYQALVDLGKLIPVSNEVVFRTQDYEEMVTKIRQLIAQEESVNVARVRDYFQTSRRYVLAFLEHLDAVGVTVRDGDIRVLKSRI